MFAELKSRALIRLTGPETRPFLQGLLSGDMTRDGAIYAALLSPQGKIVFDLIVFNRGDKTMIDCEASRADELVAKLKLYRLRAKVEIGLMTDFSVFAAWDESGVSGLPTGFTFIDPRLPALGARSIGQRPAAPAPATAPEAAYAARRRALGVPEGAGELSVEKIFLLEANAEELNGVDFKKGCYIGQELTSRMKRKAELKKRLLPLAIEGEASPGVNVTAGMEVLGQTIGGAPGIAFALLRLDRLAAARAAGAAIRIGQAPAELRVPEYLRGRL